MSDSWCAQVINDNDTHKVSFLIQTTDQKKSKDDMWNDYYLDRKLVVNLILKISACKLLIFILI
jgi:hypothetical protein